MLQLYFVTAGNLYKSTRANFDDPWSTSAPVAELNTPVVEMRPSISGDGLTMFFTRGAAGTRELFVTTRDNSTAPWAAPQLVDLDLNSDMADEHAVSVDGRTLLVETSRGGNFDLYLATRPSLGAPFTTIALDGINSDSNEGGGHATADLSTIIFHSDRTQTTAIWEAIDSGGEWHLHHHTELDTPRGDGDPWLSPDGKVIVFSRTVGSTDDLFIAVR